MTVSHGNSVTGSEHYIRHLGGYSVHMVTEVTKVQKCFKGDLIVKRMGICVAV